MLKKSTSSMRRGANQTADGTSIMMPIGIARSNGSPGLVELLPRLLEQLLDAPDLLDARDHREQSSRTRPLAPARRMARSCALKIAGISSEMRIERQPRNGFSSWCVVR